MKILFVFGKMGRGGAEMRTMELMRNIDRNQFMFDFCALSGKQGVLDEAIVKLGGAVHYCSIHGPLFFLRFIRILLTGRYDVVHSNVHYSSGLILALARLCRVPVRVAHFRSTQDGKPKTLVHRLRRLIMMRMLDWNATKILAVGRAAMESSWGESWSQDSRCMIIPNGLDPSAFIVTTDPAKVRHEFGIPAEADLIIHVGRMTAAKNHMKLARVAAIVLAQNKDRFLVMVGKEDRNLKSSMEQCFREWGVLGQVRFAGVRRNVPWIMKGSDVFLFPSCWEGLPGALLEACASGTPALVSDIPPHRELKETFPDLQLLSIKASDQDWANSVHTLMTQKPSEPQRKSALEYFKSTKYNIDRAVKGHVLAWNYCSDSS